MEVQVKLFVETVFLVNRLFYRVVIQLIRTERSVLHDQVQDNRFIFNLFWWDIAIGAAWDR